jgi:hypothetical protein
MISSGSSWYLLFPFDLYHRYKTVPPLTTSLSYPFDFHFRVSGPIHVFAIFGLNGCMYVCLRSLPPGRSPVILQLSSPAELEKP